MRKIILISLLLLLGTITLQAEEMEGSISDWSYRSLGLKLDNSEHIMARFTKKSDGSTGFCLEPTVLFIEGSSYWEDHFSHGNLEYIAKIIKSFERLGGSDSYYIAAQLMIWDALGEPQTINGDAGYNYGRSDLEAYIDSHFKKERTNLSLEKEVEFNKIYSGEDLNDLLKDHFKIKHDHIKLSQDGNHFTYQINEIYPLEKTIKTIPIEDTYDIIADSSIIYYSDQSQNIIQFRGSFPSYYGGQEITIKHKTGDLIVHKYDEWGDRCQNEATFQIFRAEKNGDQFKVLDEIKTEKGEYWTTSKGTLKISNILPMGTYALKEFKHEGYKINQEYTYFEIYEDQTTEFNYFNENEDIHLEIEKVDEDGNPIIGSKFKLYDISKTLDFDASPSILKAKDDYISSSRLYLQTQQNQDYPKSFIYFFDLNQRINLYDFYHKIHQEKANQFLNFKINQADLINQENHMIETFEEGYIDLVIEGDPKIQVIFDENISVLKDENNLTAYFEIEETSNAYLFKSRHDDFNLRFEISKEQSLKDETIEIILDDAAIYEEYRIYIQDIDEKIKIVEGLLLSNFDNSATYQFKSENNHDLYALDQEISLFKEGVEVLVNLDCGKIIEPIEAGLYDYEGQSIEIKYDPILEYQNLKFNRQYLLCEVEPANGYRYHHEPCIFFDTSENKDIHLKIQNDLRDIRFILLKENTKEILLNGAIFHVYQKTYPLQSFMQEDEEVLVGKFITGGYIFQNLNNHQYLYLVDENDAISTYETKDQVEIILRDLNPGKYEYYFSDEAYDLKEAKTSIEILYGGFIVNVPYNKDLRIEEIKAPSGYFFKEANTNYHPDLIFGINHVYNHRINEAIIVVNTAC